MWFGAAALIYACGCATVTSYAPFLPTLISCVFLLCNANQNYYIVLGVSRDASREDIRAAYHPDRHPNDKLSAGRMADVNGAYETLYDPEKRQLYDRLLSSPFQRPAAVLAMMSDFAVLPTFQIILDHHQVSTWTPSGTSRSCAASVSPTQCARTCLLLRPPNLNLCSSCGSHSPLPVPACGSAFRTIYRWFSSPSTRPLAPSRMRRVSSPQRYACCSVAGR